MGLTLLKYKLLPLTSVGFWSSGICLPCNKRRGGGGVAVKDRLEKLEERDFDKLIFLSTEEQKTEKPWNVASNGPSETNHMLLNR